MGAPPDGEVFGGETDDVDPGAETDIPSLDQMITSYRPALIDVRALPAALDMNHRAAFHRNLVIDDSTTDDLIALGESVRDVDSESAFWVIQVLAAYEGPVTEDNDGLGDLETTVGFAPGGGVDQGPALVFTEAMRDVALDIEGLAYDVLARRVTMHESIHRFGLRHGQPFGNEGPLLPANNISVAMFADGLQLMTGGQLRYVQSKEFPR